MQRRVSDKERGIVCGEHLVEQLARQRGTWSPAIVVAPGDGISVEQDLSGRTGAVESLKVHVGASTQVYAYVTSYEMIDGRWSGSITRSAEYTFAISPL